MLNNTQSGHNSVLSEEHGLQKSSAWSHFGVKNMHGRQDTQEKC